MNAIVMIDNDGYIGANGNLLYNIPEDKKYFKKMTTGKTIVMGRKTFESLPNKKPLPDRRNVVLTRDLNYNPGDGVEVIHSLQEFQSSDHYDNPDVFVIGGAAIYEQLIPFCKYVYITRLDTSLYKRTEVDAVFPFFDKETTMAKYPNKGYFWKLISNEQLRVAYWLPRDVDDESMYRVINGEKVLYARVDGCNFMIFSLTKDFWGFDCLVDKTEFKDISENKDRIEVFRTEIGC